MSQALCGILNDILHVPDQVNSELILCCLCVFIEGEWSVVCSKGPGPESTSTDVLWSEHGHGYDEEKPFNDYSPGIAIGVWKSLALDFGSCFCTFNILWGDASLAFTCVVAYFLTDSYICLGELLLFWICSR